VQNQSSSWWYVIKTARFKESYVGVQLEAIAHAEAYVPLAKLPRQHLRRGQAQIEPLFPGYVFARLDLTKQLLALRRVQAFQSLVCFDGQPACVDASIIDELRRRERGRGHISISLPKSSFLPQDSVRVTEGPFRGMAGRFVRYVDSTARVCILLDILRPQSVLELPVQAVAADPAGRASAKVA
jgi:transcriptional antiterminator RfaH